MAIKKKSTQLGEKATNLIYWSHLQVSAVPAEATGCLQKAWSVRVRKNAREHAL